MSIIYDVIIVGAGPAGLSAAIYMARAKYRVLVLEQEKIGGQITITSEVVNYPGIFHSSGTQLTEAMHKQGESFGAEYRFAKVTGIECTEKIKIIHSDQGDFQTLGLILAVGANPRKLGFSGEAKFQGRGVAYCATCDGEFFKGLDIYVVGGGFAAVEESIFLTKYAKKVHILVRGEEFSCAKTLSDKALSHDKIEVHFETELVKVDGAQSVTSLTILDRKTRKETVLEDKNGYGVFVFAGYVPNTSWLPPEIKLEDGYIITSHVGETSVDGIYAAGDVCLKELRQVVTAVSDGATAATSLEKYVEAMQIELNLPSYDPSSIENTPKIHDISPSTNVEHKLPLGKFITEEIALQLAPVIEKLESKIVIKLVRADSELSAELEVFSQEINSLSPKISITTEDSQDNLSYLEIIHENGTSSGTQYHAVPSGHEFNSFLHGMLLVSTGGNPLDEAEILEISKLSPQSLEVFISLSCTMCPELVKACQRIAYENKSISCKIIDAGHRPELRQKYHIMSVPCLVINKETVIFGKKTSQELITLLKS